MTGPQDVPALLREAKWAAMAHEDDHPRTTTTLRALAALVEAQQWLSYEALEDAAKGQLPGRIIVQVTGWKEHSGATWARSYVALVRTQLNTPLFIHEADAAMIRKQADMDGIDALTAWRPMPLPPAPGGSHE